MCNFFSLISDGRGEIKYFNWEQRQKIASGEITDKMGNKYNSDSHSSICDFYKAKEDKWNKYEFNPISDKFEVDTINTHDDSEIVERKVRALDFKTIVEPLIIKPIVIPFALPKVDKITEEHIKLLKEWDSVRAPIWDSVRDSVRASVWDSIRDSIRGSVSSSVWVSVWAYSSSFFNLRKWKNLEDLEDYKNPFQSVIDLWEQGLVPSFDGEMWRLHSGEDGKVVFTISAEELRGM